MPPLHRNERAAQQEGISILINPSNPSIPEATNPAIPTAAQLSETRLKQWHQQGEALLTMENLRSWINTAGLVLFVPRPQIASPAPGKNPCSCSTSKAVISRRNTTSPTTRPQKTRR